MTTAAATTWWSSVNLSSLNSAVRSGEFVTTRDGKLWLGERRYLGYGAVVGPWFVVSRPEDVEEGIRRAALAGISDLRIHHTDSRWYPNYFSRRETDRDPLKRTHATDRLDPEYMRALEWLIYCCAAHGIRVWLDLWCYRQFTGADLAAKPWLQPLFDKRVVGNARPGEAAGYFALHSDLRQEITRTMRQVLEWPNGYTGLQIKDDPTIAGLMLANENRFGHGVLHYDPSDNSLDSEYEAWHKTAWLQFAKHTGCDPLKPGKRWLEMFYADVEWRAFFELRANIQDLWKASRPILTHAYWGDAPFSALGAISAVGTGCDRHIYCRQTPGEPNKMAPELDARLWPSFETIVAGTSIDGMFQTITEHAPVIQSNDTRESVGACVDAMKVVADAVIRQDIDVPFLFMYQQGKALDAKDNAYEFGMSDPIMRAFADQAYRVRDVSQREIDPKLVKAGTLSIEEMFGYSVPVAQGGYVLPSPHTAFWLRDLVGQGRRVRVRMPRVDALPWLR